MKRFFVCLLAGCLLFSAPALAQQVTDMELTLDFQFGARTGRYTGELSGGLPDGSGTFASVNDEEVEWTYTGEWSNGHLEGFGTTVWREGWSEEGLYSNDYLNGEAAEYRYGTVIRRGTYTNGFPVRGQEFDELGNPYFEGDFEDGFRIESAAEQAVRLAAFFSEAVDYDYDLIWRDYERYIGQKVVFAGKASHVWEGGYPAYQEFAIDINNDPDEWIDVFGFMAKGERAIVKGEENVMVYGVLLEKCRWEDDEGTHSAPMVQVVGVERLDFACQKLVTGSKGKGVKALQIRLKELGYYAGSVDGAFGKGTAQSVADFQSASGLPADGAASLKTLYTLFAAQNLPDGTGYTAQPGLDIDVAGTYAFIGIKKYPGYILVRGNEAAFTTKMDPFTASVERSGSEMTISLGDESATVIRGTYDESTAAFTGRVAKTTALWKKADVTIHFSFADGAVVGDGSLETGELVIETISPTKTTILIEFTLTKTS